MVVFDKLIRIALSMPFGVTPMAVSTSLRWPFAQAEPAETQIPIDESELSITCDGTPSTEMLIIYGSASCGELR